MSEHGKIIQFDGEHSDIRVTAPAPWEQYHGESCKAFNAFRLYLGQGIDRGLRKVDEECAKSESLIRRWSARWNWRERVLAFDRFEARTIHERILSQLARIRERDLKLAESLDEKSRLRLDTMKSDEVDRLSPMELATLIRVSADLKYKAVDVSAEEHIAEGFSSSMPVPVFIIKTIPERPIGYVYVRFGDDPIRDGWTWIREEEVADYRKAHPNHTVIA